MESTADPIFILKIFRLKIFKIILFSCFSFLTACSSWELQERCEKTNWFEYSRDVAQSGRYLEEDGFIKDCKGVDRISSSQIDIGFKSGRQRYCTYENFLRLGQSGEPVNFKLCDNLILAQMQQRYGSGLKDFCVAKVGYDYGSGGKKYKNVCFKPAEEKFLQSYYTGRREYLEKSILQVGQDIQNLQQAQQQVSYQLSSVTNEIHLLPSPQECRVQDVYDPGLQKSVSRNICEEASYIRFQRQTLHSHHTALLSQFQQHAEILTRMLTSLADHRTELTKIPTSQNLSVP